MSGNPRIGRPKTAHNPETDPYLLHARQSNVTAEVLAAVSHGAYEYQNPVIRLLVADAVLHLEEALREVRQDAVKELRKTRTWSEVGSILGVSRQRAWQIGNGR